MLSWVVKVVPQPPEPLPKRVEDQKEQKPAAAPAAPPAQVSHTIVYVICLLKNMRDSVLQIQNGGNTCG